MRELPSHTLHYISYNVSPRGVFLDISIYAKRRDRIFDRLPQWVALKIAVRVDKFAIFPGPSLCFLVRPARFACH